MELRYGSCGELVQLSRAHKGYGQFQECEGRFQMQRNVTKLKTAPLPCRLQPLKVRDTRVKSGQRVWPELHPLMNFSSGPVPAGTR